MIECWSLEVLAQPPTPERQHPRTPTLHHPTLHHPKTPNHANTCHRTIT